MVAGEERHATIDRSLRLLGIGADALESVPTGPNGAVDPDALAAAVCDIEAACASGSAQKTNPAS